MEVKMENVHQRLKELGLYVKLFYNGEQISFAEDGRISISISSPSFEGLQKMVMRVALPADEFFNAVICNQDQPIRQKRYHEFKQRLYYQLTVVLHNGFTPYATNHLTLLRVDEAGVVSVYELAVVSQQQQSAVDGQQRFYLSFQTIYQVACFKRRGKLVFVERPRRSWPELLEFLETYLTEVPEVQGLLELSERKKALTIFFPSTSASFTSIMPSVHCV